MASFSDGLVVVCDKVQVLERIAEMLDQVEAAESPTWCVQLHIVALGESDVKELGLQSTPSLQVAATFAAGSGMSAALTNNAAQAGLGAALKVAAERGATRVVGQPCFLLADGCESEFLRTRRYPVKRADLGYEGRVSSQSYEYVDVGLTVRVKLRERSARSAMLGVECELSDTDGAVDGVPIRVVEHYTTGAVVESGGVYLLGSLERSALSSRKWTWLYWGSGTNKERQTLYVWATAKAVAGGVVNGEPVEECKRLPGVVSR